MQSELLRQREQLCSIKNRLIEAIDTLLPSARGEHWRGPAQMLYALGLARLGADAASCVDRVDEALQYTEQALATMGSYGTAG